MFPADKASSEAPAKPTTKARPPSSKPVLTTSIGNSPSLSSALRSARASHTTARSQIASSSALPNTTNLPSLNPNATSRQLNGTAAHYDSQDGLGSVGGVAGLIGVITAVGSIAIFGAMLFFYVMRRRRRRQQVAVSPTQNEKKPRASWRSISRLPSWKPLSVGGGNRGDDNDDAWSWEHLSQQGSKANLQDFPEIVVMDTRPAARQSTDYVPPSQQPYDFGTPYSTASTPYSTPPTPYMPDDLDYSAMTDEDPEFDASPPSHGYYPTHAPTTYIPPRSHIPLPSRTPSPPSSSRNRSPSVSSSNYSLSSSSISRFPPTPATAPKRAPSSSNSKPSHIPLAKRNVRGSISTMIPPVTNPPPRRDSLDIAQYGLPRSSLISRGSIGSSAGSPSSTPTPSSPLRRPRKEHGMEEKNVIMEEADVGNPRSSHFPGSGRRAPIQKS